MDSKVMLMGNIEEGDEGRADGLALASDATLWRSGRTDPEWSSQEGASRESAEDVSGLELFRAVIRQVPLLTPEQELALGRDLHESRLVMTAALSRVPMAIELFLAALDEAVAGEAPLINVLYSPFGASSAKDLEAESDEAAPAAGASTEARKPREIASELARACAEWRALAHIPGAELEAAKTRTASAFHAIEPAFPVLCRALDACKHLDDRVRGLETHLALCDADLGSALESALGVRNDAGLAGSERERRRLEPARAELMRIETESGTSLATLRETRRTALQAAARYRTARQHMVEANLRLAYYTARKFVNHGVALDDLVQAANLGLIRAADKFDYRLGYKFSTYASQWIWQSVTRVLADESRTIRVAAHMHDTILRINKAERQLQQKLGRSPTLEELAEATELPQRKIRKALQSAQHTLSLDAPVSEMEDTTLQHWLEDDEQPDPSETTQDAQVERAITELLATLPEREALILRLRHGIGVAEPMTLEQIGGVLGITRERTRQLETRAMTRLRRRASPDLVRALSA